MGNSAADNVTESRSPDAEQEYKGEQGITMRPADLQLRCYAERDQDGSWFAMCIDLNLYARADSLKAVRKELHAIIGDYVREAFGTDRAHFQELLHRRAPLSFVLKYHFIRAVCAIERRKRNRGDRPRHFPYNDQLPVVPA